MQRVHGIAGLIGCIAALAASSATDAVAAVRVCQPPVASELSSDPVESRARAKAISGWTLKARSAGSQNASWRIADKKMLRCARLPAGRFDCVAVGRPCIIRQTPPPAKRGKSKQPAIAI
jgi:hypothetical protein